MTTPRPIPFGMEPPPMTTARPTPSPRRGNQPKGEARQGKAAAPSRFHALNTFADGTLAYLSRNEIAVWLVLFRDTHGRDASTGIADLARRAGCHRATAMRVLKRLQAAGLVRRLRRGAAGAGPSVYRISGELSPEVRDQLERER